MKIFTVGGWSQSGKTTLIVRLIEYFNSQNTKVITVKGVRKYNLQPAAKDSSLFLSAGADWVWVVADREMMRFRRVTDKAEARKVLVKDFEDADMVLLEGYYFDHVPIIEVFDSRKHRRLKFALDRLVAVVADCRVTDRVPCFDKNNIPGIAHFMEAYDGQ